MESVERTKKDQHQLGCHQLSHQEHLEQKRKKMEKTSTQEERFLFPSQDIAPLEGEVNSLTPKKRGRRRSMVTEERPAMTEERMRKILEGTQEIETPTGIKYIHLRLTKRMIIGVRESSGKEFTINLDELYKAYQQCLRFTSPEVKRYIFMGHSPAVVLLKLLKEKA